MLTNRFVVPHDRLVLDELGVRIRVVNCDGESVALEVIAPPSIPVGVSEDDFPQTRCDETQHVLRPSSLGRSE